MNCDINAVDVYKHAKCYIDASRCRSNRWHVYRCCIMKYQCVGLSCNVYCTYYWSTTNALHAINWCMLHMSPIMSQFKCVVAINSIYYSIFDCWDMLLMLPISATFNACCGSWLNISSFLSVYHAYYAYPQYVCYRCIMQDIHTYYYTMMHDIHARRLKRKYKKA